MVSSVLTFDGGKSSTTSTTQTTQQQQITQQSSSTTTSSSIIENKNYQTKSTSSSGALNDPSTLSSPTSSSLNDQISILFPKCRPRNDVNLNHLTNSTVTKFQSDIGVTGSTSLSGLTSLNTVTSLHQQQQQQQQSPPTSSLSSSDSSSAITKSPNNPIGTNPFLSSNIQQYHGDYISDNNSQKQLGFENREYSSNNSKSSSSLVTAVTLGNTKIMSSNIDGVSKYSQKRPSHGNKSHNYYQYNQNPFIKDSERSIWELRSQRNGGNTALNQSNVVQSANSGGCNSGSANPNKVLNSPDLIEMETKLNFQKNHSIKVGRSPVSARPPAMGMEAPQLTNSTSNGNPRTVNMISDGEVLVFDDIGESYTNKGHGDSISALYGGGGGGGSLGQTPDLYSCTTEIKKNDYSDLRNSAGIMGKLIY